MSEQLDAVYDWMIANGKHLRNGKRKKSNPRAKKIIEPKDAVVTIGEIMSMLENMQVGSKSAFAQYLVTNEIFKSTKDALNTLRDYRSRRANCATFLIRQTISDLFREWRYEYGGRIKRQNKQLVIEEYNYKLSKYWEKAAWPT